MFARRRRGRQRQVAPASYTASHVDHEEETLGFHNFYAWVSSVSPISRHFLSRRVGWIQH